MVNILDVAARADVSRSTVSRVLNHSDHVDKETKDRVLQAIKELGYQPSRIAQSLRKQKTQMIAVLIPRVSNTFYSVLMQGIESEAAQYGFHVILCNTENDPKKELHYLQMIEHHQVDGILMTSLINSKELVYSFEAFGPIVLINDYTKENLFPTVTVDHYSAAYGATVHLIRQGHTRLGMIGGSRESLIAFDRELGFRQAIIDNDLPIREEWIKESKYSISSGNEYIQQLLHTGEFPSAVFAGNDELAIGVIQAMKEQGYRVPDDLAVVGYDGLIIGTIVEPNLTTVIQPIEQLGRQGMKLLLRKLNGEPLTTNRMILPTQLRIGKSSGL